MQLDQFFGTQVGAAVATFELPSLELARIAPIPYDGGTFYGGGAVYDGGYLYAYGWQAADCLFCAGHLGLARVREDLVQVPSRVGSAPRAGRGRVIHARRGPCSVTRRASPTYSPTTTASCWSPSR